MQIKKGDNIIVITGKDKGKKGKILKVFTATGKVIVEGLNVIKKHQRSRKSDSKGQIVVKSMPLYASNVMLIDPKSGTQTRVGKKSIGGKMVRIARKSGQEI